jgi:drug/metabolite transporter (DMT)-like permease
LRKDKLVCAQYKFLVKMQRWGYNESHYTKKERLSMKSPSVRASALAPYALILLQNVIYGFGDPISKVAYDTVPVFSLLAARYLMAFTFLLLLFGKRTVQELKTAPRRQLILPCLCISSNLIGNVALVLTSATSVAFLRSLSTVIVPLLAAIVYRQNLPKKLLLVYVLVVLGSYLLCGMGGLSGFGWGEVLSLLCAVLIAGSLLFGQRSLDCVSATTLTTLQSAAATVLALACSFLFEGGIHVSNVSPLAWSIIAYLAILCTSLGYFLQNKAMCAISARSVALLQCLCPVMTALFSFLLLGERLSAAGILGSALLLIALVAATLLRSETPAERIRKS